MENELKGVDSDMILSLIGALSMYENF